jgi:hypothetical protein
MTFCDTPHTHTCTHTHTHTLKLHTDGLHLMHVIITEYIVCRDNSYITFSCQSKLSVIRELPFSAPPHHRSSLQSQPWQKIGALSCRSDPLLSVGVYSTFNKSTLCLLILCAVSKTLLTSPRAWTIHDWQVLTPLPTVPTLLPDGGEWGTCSRGAGWLWLP